MNISSRARTFYQFNVANALAVLSGILVTGIVAFSITVFGVQAAILWTGLIAFVLGTVLLLHGWRPNPANIFFLLFIGMLFLPLIVKTAGWPVFGAWQIVVFALGLFGAKRFVDQLRDSRLALVAVLLFTLFLLQLSVATITGRSHFFAAAYQFVSDLKPLVLIMLGYGLKFEGRVEDRFWALVRWYWLLELIFIAAEWIAPSTYFSIFGAWIGGASVDETGWLPSRATGPFEAPQMLATTSALFAIISFCRHLENPKHEARYAWLTIIYLVIIGCAVQRSELAGCLGALFLVFLLSRPDLILRRMSIVMLIVPPFVFLFLAVYADLILREAFYWGLNPTGRIDQPRAQLVFWANRIAYEYFPFGSGLGTFGGAGAQHFDLSLYESLGFRNYWWYGKEDYLMDMYWPNPLAEGGYLGSALLASFYFALLTLAVRMTFLEHGPARKYWLFATGSMAYMILLSLTAPSFQDPRLFLLSAAFYGIAYNRGARTR